MKKKQHSFKQFSALPSLSACLYFQHTNKTQLQCIARLNLYSSLSSFCFAYCAQVFVRGIRTAPSVTAGKTCTVTNLMMVFQYLPADAQLKEMWLSINKQPCKDICCWSIWQCPHSGRRTHHWILIQLLNETHSHLSPIRLKTKITGTLDICFELLYNYHDYIFFLGFQVQICCVISRKRHMKVMRGRREMWQQRRAK